VAVAARTVIVEQQVLRRRSPVGRDQCRRDQIAAARRQRQPDAQRAVGLDHRWIRRRVLDLRDRRHVAVDQHHVHDRRARLVDRRIAPDAGHAQRLDGAAGAVAHLQVQVRLRRAAGAAGDRQRRARRDPLAGPHARRAAADVAVEDREPVGVAHAHHVPAAGAGDVAVGLIIDHLFDHAGGHRVDYGASVVHFSKRRDVDVDSLMPVVGAGARAGPTAEVGDVRARRVEVDVVVDHPVAAVAAVEREAHDREVG